MTLAQYWLCQGPTEQSCCATDTVLISACFPEACTGITVLTITNSLFLRLKLLLQDFTCHWKQAA